MSCAVHGVGARRRRQRELADEDAQAHIDEMRRLVREAIRDRRARQREILLRAYGKDSNWPLGLKGVITPHG